MNDSLPIPEFAAGKCTISDDWIYKDMQVIWMENDFLKIGILAGRGSDIFEFRYKPFNLDFMLRLAKDIQNPRHIFSQMRDTPNQFEDYYYGGGLTGTAWGNIFDPLETCHWYQQRRKNIGHTLDAPPAYAGTN